MIGAETRARIEELTARYPTRRGGLLPALRLVQREAGHVSHEAMRELAALFELRPNEVAELVSFYDLLDDAPRGRHRVAVCTNLPCSLRGARDLLRALEAHLGVRAGETTSDGRIGLSGAECLGACAYAPMMRVDDTYHEDLDVERAKAVVDGLG